MIPFKAPMLAASLLPPNIEHTDSNILEAMSSLKFPVLATLKLDGIRAIKLGDLASRTLKKIPNLSIQERSNRLPYYMDMELFNYDLSYDEIESIVMSKEHPDSDKIQFHLLDWWGIENNPCYSMRMSFIEGWHTQNKLLDARFVYPTHCDNAQQLFDFFLSCEREEGEGICCRTPLSPYKQGRSTLKEQHLIKLARFITAEAIIIGMLEQQMNTNSEKRNEVGTMNRRRTLSGQQGKGILGALLAKDTITGLTFKVGTGFNDIQRQEMWDNKSSYIGKIISYKSKKHGEKLLPRCPTFRGMREKGF